MVAPLPEDNNILFIYLTFLQSSVAKLLLLSKGEDKPRRFVVVVTDQNLLCSLSRMLHVESSGCAVYPGCVLTIFRANTALSSVWAADNANVTGAGE